MVAHESLRIAIGNTLPIQEIASQSSSTFQVGISKTEVLVRIVGRNNYRNAVAALNASFPGIVDQVEAILQHPENNLVFEKKGKQYYFSKQVQGWFTSQGWQSEAPCFAISDMRYDLLKKSVPLEIEIGHQRLVFPDFFKFMADYSKGQIPAAIMAVTGNPDLFGHNWHCSLDSTNRKIQAISEVFLVPVLVIGVDP